MTFFRSKENNAEVGHHDIEVPEINFGTPQAVDWQIAHKRLVFLFRGSITMNFGLVGIIAILASILYGLFPLKEIQLGLIRFDSAENQLAWVEPVRRDIDGLDTYIEEHTKRFIKLTQTIDGNSEAERFQEAIWMASTKVWQDFEKTRIKSGAIQSVIDGKGSRSIRINVAQKIESLTRGVDKIRVEFTQIDQRGGKVISETQIEAIVGIVLAPGEVKVSQRYMNPLGVTVVAFSMRIKNEG